MQSCSFFKLSYEPFTVRQLLRKKIYLTSIVEIRQIVFSLFIQIILVIGIN